MRAAWALGDAGRAITELEQLICSLDHQRPGDAATPRKSLAETLTITRLGSKLLQTVESTNPIESMTEIVGDHATRGETLELRR